MTNLSPHARAVLERISDKGFMMGIPTGMVTRHSQEYRDMQAGFAELMRAGLVVEEIVTAQASRYELANASVSPLVQADS